MEGILLFANGHTNIPPSNEGFNYINEGKGRKNGLFNEQKRR